MRYLGYFFGAVGLATGLLGVLADRSSLALAGAVVTVCGAYLVRDNPRH